MGQTSTDRHPCMIRARMKSSPSGVPDLFSTGVNFSKALDLTTSLLNIVLIGTDSIRP